MCIFVNTNTMNKICVYVECRRCEWVSEHEATVSMEVYHTFDGESWWYNVDEKYLDFWIKVL